MAKKIRLIDDETDEASSVAEKTSGIKMEADDQFVAKQLLKYLEAIDWKLWEILKLMKNNLPEDKEEN